jgi:hypothetical protein
MTVRRWTLVLLATLVAGAAIGSIAAAEVVQKGDVRAKFEGELTPKALPRSGSAPVRVAVGAKSRR